MMKKLFKLAAVTVIAGMVISCNDPSSGNGNNNGNDNDKPDTEDPTPAIPANFAKGADISWATEMEEDGIKFSTADGREMECTALMKELGFNSIRLRVWVNPAEGWCAKEDVLEKARRAHNLGMRLMVDFHYSDWWADPATQTKPKEWTDYTMDELCEAVSSHTTEILTSLKDEGITPEWVQVGNETSNGMLWEDGRASSNMANYARLTTAGYDAVKAVFPEAKVIVHLDHGDNNSLYTWIFNGLKENGGKWDMIGMSIYPEYYVADGNYTDGDYAEVVAATLNNIIALYQTFGTPSIICEAGMTWNKEEESYKFLSALLERAAGLDNNICAGVFYWEPQCNPAWLSSIYEEIGWGSYDKGAFDENFRPTKALDAFKN